MHTTTALFSRTFHCGCERGRDHQEWKQHWISSDPVLISAAARMREDRKLNPLKYKGYELRKRFRISLDEFNDLLAAQDFKCKACGSPEPHGPSKQWQIDHDHSCCPSSRKTCGKCIRGLLCHYCNLTLGNAKEDIGRLESLVRYLTECRSESANAA